MTMAEQNPVAHLLDGMVRCRTCNAPMETIGVSFGETPKYVCPRRRDDCDTPEVPSEVLARLMVGRVISAALEGDNAKQVAETVREDAQQRAEDYTLARIDEAFRTMPYEPPMMRPHPSEYMPEPDPEMRRLLELDPAEYIEPLRRLDRYWSVTGDTGHIEQYAFDLNTYLRPSNIRTTRAIVETAVDEIRVGSGSATIMYRTAMPPGSGAKGRTQEEVDLPS